MYETSTGKQALIVIVSLLIGGVVGFFLGVASTELGEEFLEGMVATEQPADTGSPQTHDRDRFTLQYPSNWKIDTEDEDYDPDQMFFIESPGAAFVLFVIMDWESDIEENIQEQVDAFSKFLGSPEKSEFRTWGEFSGLGAKMTGRVLGIETTVKVFSYSEDEASFIIVMQYPEEDLSYLSAGFDLIENSFSLKN